MLVKGKLTYGQHKDLTISVCYASMMQMWVEQPCVGVPGLVNFVGARSRWLDLQINAACRTEAVTQAVILRSGLDSRACRLKLPGLQFYEVDDREALAQKRALLDAGEQRGGGAARHTGGGGRQRTGALVGSVITFCWPCMDQRLTIVYLLLLRACSAA